MSFPNISIINTRSLPSVHLMVALKTNKQNFIKKQLNNSFSTLNLLKLGHKSLKNDGNCASFFLLVSMRSSFCRVQAFFYYGENPKAHGAVFLKQIIHCLLHHPNFSNERLILLNKLLSVDKSFLSKCNSDISKVCKYLMMQKNTCYNYINSISTSIQQIFVMLYYITLETKLSFSVVYLKFLFTYIQVFLA